MAISNFGGTVTNDEFIDLAIDLDDCAIRCVCCHGLGRCDCHPGCWQFIENYVFLDYIEAVHRVIDQQEGAE